MKEEKINIIIDKEKCASCGMCKADCPLFILAKQNENASIPPDDCLECGHCYAVCPQNAITMKGYEDELNTSDKLKFLNDIDLHTHLKSRRSIRQYKKTPVEKEKLEKIIEAGRLTPTGSNQQNVRYIVLQDELEVIEDMLLKQYKKLAKLASFIGRFIKLPYDVSSYKFERGFLFHKAPAVILIISPSETNACLAAMNMELMAETLGLGTLYVGLFTRPANMNRKLRKLLGIAKKEKIAICLTVGYASVKYKRPALRKKASVIWR
ncbi:MAG: nitroreductase family protein [Treponema sp.]|jgi:nitroreductase/Pyruvate/2-oxoacid:ferredoxin oxidoreductase delta subunit|nr:nitroreductase family protein [Treponema sp.]